MVWSNAIQFDSRGNRFPTRGQIHTTHNPHYGRIETIIHFNVPYVRIVPHAAARSSPKFALTPHGRPRNEVSAIVNPNALELPALAHLPDATIRQCKIVRGAAHRVVAGFWETHGLFRVHGIYSIVPRAAGQPAEPRHRNHVGEKDMKESKVCPWCGCDELNNLCQITKNPKYAGKPNYRDWKCGSWQRGIEPMQDANCRNNELEKTIDEILGVASRAVSIYCDWYDRGNPRGMTASTVGYEQYSACGKILELTKGANDNNG